MATVMRYFCLHFTSVQLSRYVCSYTLFFSKDVVFSAQGEYSYFSADFRLKIFLYYSYIIAYGIFVLFRIYWAINRPRSIYQYSSMAPRLSGQSCKFFKFLLSLNSQKRLGYKENNTKYRSLTWKPRSHVRILIYRTWPITSVWFLDLDRVQYIVHVL